MRYILARVFYGKGSIRALLAELFGLAAMTLAFWIAAWILAALSA